MTQNRDIWLKAAVAGSLWGASEIVLGTFLHSLRIPFSSNLLTAIGIVLMISAQRLWPQRGLIWRAGIICAALKTLSPSHAIFGPMIAIGMQALLMQSAVWLGGRSAAAYLIGGGLAMTWNLAQRVLTALIVYGASLVDLYQSMVDYLFQNTGLVFNGYWAPLWWLASIFFAGGMLAALAGILISRSTSQTHPLIIKLSQQPFRQPKSNLGKGSAFLPLVILVILFGALLLLQRLDIFTSLVMVAALLTLAAWHDRSLLRGVLQKPGFWVGLLAVAMLSGLLLGKRPGHAWVSIDGLKTGIKMGLRALLVITGFRALGRELRNPGLAEWFGKRKLENFLMATRIAFQTTPLLLEAIPAREAWKNPAKALKQLAGSMAPALEYMKSQQKPEKVFMLTGKKGSGKTTLVLKLTNSLQQHEISVAGIAAPSIIENGERTGYNLRDLSSGKEVFFSRRTGESNKENPVPFIFEEAGFSFGKMVLNKAVFSESDLIIIDEVGPLEMQDSGWAAALSEVLALRTTPVLLVVRPSLAESVSEKWKLENPIIFDLEKCGEASIVQRILHEMKQ